MKKEFIFNSQFTTIIQSKKSNYQNPLLTATEENKKSFDCNIVNNYFNDDFDDESAPSKDTKNTGIRHIDHR